MCSRMETKKQMASKCANSRWAKQKCIVYIALCLKEDIHEKNILKNYLVYTITAWTTNSKKTGKTLKKYWEDFMWVVNSDTEQFESPIRCASFMFRLKSPKQE